MRTYSGLRVVVVVVLETGEISEEVAVAGHGQQGDVSGEEHGGENDDFQWSALTTGLLVIFFTETEKRRRNQSTLGLGTELS